MLRSVEPRSQDPIKSHNVPSAFDQWLKRHNDHYCAELPALRQQRKKLCEQHKKEVAASVSRFGGAAKGGLLDRAVALFKS